MTNKEKSSRFEEGKHVDVPKYLREHGNEEAAEKWEEYDGKVRELTAKALMDVVHHHPEHRRRVAAILRAAKGFEVLLFEDPKSKKHDWQGPLEELLADNEDALDEADLDKLRKLAPGKSMMVDFGAGGLRKIQRKK